ncbi:uncharacterized protein LOC111036044 [Myzus persicae]|uniref:uncharacterized protein LOC111036044 n=1 Tax=Myzus persicae TaxID=13164 RepID=UPI000B9334FE|nr:uncharacterized protein LOC111036044 [Myzus persicae]
MRKYINKLCFRCVSITEAKCIWLVREKAELNILLFGVLQSSVLRRQSVPENSVGLRCCHEAVGMSVLPETLMELVGNVTSQTFLDDLLKLSYTVAAVSGQSAIRMMESDGVRKLVDTLKPNFLWMPLVSFERFTLCEFVIMLLNRMFSVWSSQSSASGDATNFILQPPRVGRNTLETVLCNIKIETERNNENSMKLRNDFCYMLGEIVDNCSIDKDEYSVDIVTDIVMLCVWPEIIHISHWLEDVPFDPVTENFILKSIMLDIANKVFINLSSDIKYQQLNTFLIKEFITLLNVEYSKDIYGDNLHNILNRLLLNLPYLLLNSIDSSIKTECCTELLAFVKSLKNQKRFSCTMVNAIICIGIVSNDDYDILRKFKTLKADVLINSVILDTLKIQEYDYQDISLYGLNTLNVFYRENQQNPEGQPMVFDTVTRMLELYSVENVDWNINQNILLDLLHFIKNAIIRYNDQVELFIKAKGIEHILNALIISKYPIQLVILTTLVDLASFKSAKCHIKKWKSAKTGKGYLESVCEIWRRETVRFNFIDDEFVFQEQRDATTAANLASLCSPTVESMFMCAQPKIYLLVQLVEFAGSEDDRSHCRDEPDHDIEESTIRACSLVPGLEDKATVAHIYHYYSLKLGEIWHENDMVARAGDVEGVELTPAISQSVDVMAARHSYLTSLITMIKSRVTDLHAGESEIELEKKLYEEIRHYNNSKAHINISSVTQNPHKTCNENNISVTY